MKVSSLLLTGPLALASVLSSLPSTALAATHQQNSAGPLPISDVSRASAERKGLKCSSNPYVPRSFIVELESSAGSSNAGEKRDDPHSRLHQHLEARGKKGTYKTRFEWNNPETFVGMSVVLENDDDYHVLLDAPNVKAVHRNHLYNLPAFDPVVASNDFVRASVGADKNAKRSAPSGAEAGVKDTFAPHVMTGVDKLHAQGYFGKGQTVAVIDSGIDYTHPALGGRPGYKPCFGKGCKVIGGFDFVGDAYTGSNNPVSDSDPFADCEGSGHGTHVAGTIAANDTKLGFTGVAPHANLRAYRVFGCRGSSADDVIISALQRAYFDKNDILSLSIGGAGGWLQSSSANVAGKIVALGTPVVIANGNEGAFGTYYGSSPATGAGVAAIGSVNNVELTGYTAKVSPTGLGQDTILYLVGSPFKFNGSAQLEVYAISTDPNVADDACSPLPDSTPDLSDKVVVVGRGTCTFATKFANVFAKGGRYVFIYNTPPPASITYVQTDIRGQQAATLTREAGLFLKSQFAASKKVTLDFSDADVSTVPDTASGGLLSSFSTYGLSNENRLLPSISAPGGNILSTWPVKLGNYSIISGTSMATPFVSGSFAVYRAAHGGKTSPVDLVTLFGSTGNPLRQTKANTSDYETLAKQGSGLTDTYAAFYQDVTYSPRVLELNDTVYFDGKHKVTLHNSGRKARVFKLEHQPVGTAISKDANATAIFNDGPVPLVNNKATVELSKTVVVPPGGKASFSVRITPPSGLDGGQLPIYSGYIHLTPANKGYTGLRIPYAGTVGDLSRTKVLDDTDELFGYQLPYLNSTAGKPIQDDSHSFVLPQEDTPASLKNGPSFVLRLVFGTPLYQVDVVLANTTFQPTIAIRDGSATAQHRRTIELLGDNGFSVVRRASASSHHASKKPASSSKPKPAPAKDVNFDDVDTLGILYRETWAGRNSATGSSDDYSFISLPISRTLAGAKGGSVVLPDGEYRFLLRAQKVFTQGIKESDYESYLSHKFTIKSESDSE